MFQSPGSRTHQVHEVHLLRSRMQSHILARAMALAQQAPYCRTRASLGAAAAKPRAAQPTSPIPIATATHSSLCRVAVCILAAASRSYATHGEPVWNDELRCTYPNRSDTIEGPQDPGNQPEGVSASDAEGWSEDPSLRRRGPRDEMESLPRERL